jgi:NHL repeat-containing protein
MCMRTARIVIVAALAALSASCAGSGLPTFGTPHSTAPVAPDLTGVKIYAVDTTDLAVYGFGFKTNGDVKPSFKLFGSNTGFTAPIGDDNDSSGQLYVLQQSNFEVFGVGAKGNIPPRFVVSGALTQLDNPQGIAVDASGTTYVTNSSGGQSYISVYAPGSNGDRAPVQTIFDGLDFFFIPAGIALFNGTLYVADPGDQSLNEYPASSNGIVNPTRVITGLNTPRGVAVDAKGRIYVTDSDRILVYAANANGDATPLRTISGSNTQLNGAAGLSVHGSVIVVANAGSPGSITVYPTTGNGDIAPLREIAGSATLLAQPEDIDIH